MMNRKTMLMLVLLHTLLGVWLFWRNNYNVDIQMIRAHKWQRISGSHRFRILNNNYIFDFNAPSTPFRLTDAGGIYSLPPPNHKYPPSYPTYLAYSNCYVAEIVRKHHDYRHIYMTIRDLNHDESNYISDY